MKRTSLLLLAGVVLLSSCTSIGIKNEKNNTCASFYIEGELPEIGEFSGNRESWSDDGYTSSFIPSEEYKHLIPFVSKAKTYTSEPMGGTYSASGVYMSYGFCTPEGKVVWEPDGLINNVYHNKTDDGFGYYQVYINDEDEQNLEGGAMYAPQDNMLIPESGEWCLQLSKGTWISSVNFGSIVTHSPIETDEYGYPIKSAIRVYGYDGVLKTEFADIDNLEASGENLFITRSYSQAESTARFVNLEGETVYGPYRYAEAFNKYGISNVTDFNGDSYFIKSDGSRLNDKVYEDISVIYGNGENKAYKALHKGSTVETDIYGIDGSFICTVTNKNRYSDISFTKEGNVISSYYNGDGYVYTNSDGSLFVNEEGISPNDHCKSEGIFVHKDSETGVGTVFDGNGKNLAKLWELEYLSDVKNDAKFLVYTTGNVRFEYDELTDSEMIINTAKLNIFDVEKQETVHTFASEGSGRFFGENDRYIELSTYDTANFFYGGNGKFHLYDTVTGQFVFEDCLNINEYTIDGKMYFCVCTENKSALYDENMNVLVSFYYE